MIDSVAPSPTRLRKQPRLLQRLTPRPSDVMSLDGPIGGPSVASKVRSTRRIASVLLWTMPAVALQAIFLAMPGRANVMFGRLYWAAFARMMGIQVRVIGQLASGTSDRPVIFVSNHSSWVDIPVVGGVLDGCFVAKGDVAKWPVIGTIARLGRTVFVSRQRGSTARERDEMVGLLGNGNNLILFPEGTSSDGSRVLPFRSTFFSIAECEAKPVIQPVSVVYDRIDGFPAGRASRPVTAWYGDMDIASHFWRMGRHRGMRATVLLHTPLDPAGFANRKALCQAVWQTVADGASTLRQNRPARPLDVAGADAPIGGEVFA